MTSENVDDWSDKLQNLHALWTSLDRILPDQTTLKWYCLDCKHDIAVEDVNKGATHLCDEGVGVCVLAVRPATPA